MPTCAICMRCLQSEIPDVEGPDMGNCFATVDEDMGLVVTDAPQYCFSDGVGRISSQLLDEVLKELPFASINLGPISAIQVCMALRHACRAYHAVDTCGHTLAATVLTLVHLAPEGLVSTSQSVHTTASHAGPYWYCVLGSSRNKQNAPIQCCKKAAIVLPRAQVRFQGYKGVLSRFSGLSGRAIQLRPSMNKFGSKHPKLEVVSVAACRPAYLNRQVIIMMNYNGVPREVRDQLRRRILVYKLVAKSVGATDDMVVPAVLAD